LNYRHQFHAGNFADLVKHAALLAALEQLQRDPAALHVIDTHAGAGAYDLAPEALERGEAVAARRLAEGDAPPVFDLLKQAIGRASSEKGFVYPGSPLLIAERLRPQDGFVACELRPDDHGALVARIGGDPRIELLQRDGYDEAAARLRGSRGRSLVLVDPPFERADDYARVVDLLGRGLGSAPRTVFMVWAPLKDLETFDRLLREVEALGPRAGLVAEVRLRPPLDPMKLNGCAMIVLNAPALAPALQAACSWVAGAFGSSGGGGRVWPLAAAL
jgi:23S rRNA (adenine2030-N6)-methyltransferase